MQPKKNYEKTNQNDQNANGVYGALEFVGAEGQGRQGREIYLFVKLKLFLMSQVLLSNEQQESFRNAYLKKRKTSSCKSVKKKKKAQRHNSKMGKRPRLYTEKFKSIHRREGIHELARITFLAYQTSKHFVGLSNKYAMLAKLFTYLFIPGVAKTFLCKYALLSLSDVECYAEKGVGQSSGSGPV